MTGNVVAVTIGCNSIRFDSWKHLVIFYSKEAHHVPKKNAASLRSTRIRRDTFVLRMSVGYRA